MANETPAAGAERPSLERQLAAIWSDVLDVDAIQPTDTFVDLGGDSIAAILCVNQVQKRLGRQVTLAVVLDDETTLGRLAERLRAAPEPR
jgi:acyl carrier protein